MPLFEYHCTTCGHTIEVLQKDARVLSVCGEDCVADAGNGELRRKLSPHSVIGAGSGASFDAGPATCGSCGQAPGSCAYDN